MYRVYIQDISDASRTLIYTSDSSDSLIEDPKVSFEWDQPVTFSFSMYPEHPAFNNITPIATFVTVEWDSEELFFGRVLTAEIDLFKKKEIYCEGALSFLSDGEVSEYDDTTSISAFFTRCITEYNQTVEARKRFSIGTIDFTESNVYFKVEKHADPKSVLDDQLVKRFGGCIVIKKTFSGHSINYLKQVGSVKTNRIQLGENVKDRTDHNSGESIFSILRPTGGTKSGENDPVVITSNNGLIEIPAMIAKYGRIIKRETFSDQLTEEGLRSAAMAFISRLGMANDKLPVTIDIGYVDFCYLNPSISRIYFGDVFTDIEGYPGESMAVGRLELDLSNPANDSLSLYNKTYLDAREYSAILNSSTGSTSGGRGGRGGGGGSALAGLLSDMEQEQTDVLNIGGENIKRLNIHANSVDGYITLSSHQISLQSEVLFGSNRTYDMISTDVEEMWGSQMHADGNGFWNMYGTVVKDDTGRIVVKGDSGLAVEKTDASGRKVTVGVYDELGLTAGLLIDKINSEDTTYLLGDKILLGNVSYTYSVIRPELSDNPRALGYYELQNGSYVLTSDLERVPGKNYYLKKYNVAPNGDTIGTRIEKETERISLVVEGYGENASIKPASIVAAINQGDGVSEIKMRADRIAIDSSSGSSFHINENGVMSFDANNAVTAINAATTEINSDKIALTTGSSSVTLGDKFAIDTNGYILLKGATVVDGNLDLTQNHSISARNFTVGTGGSIRLVGGSSGEYYDLSTANIPECIRDLRFIVDPNNSGHYILQKKTIYNSNTWTDATNFNIAATQYFLDTLAKVSFPSTPRTSANFEVAAPGPVDANNAVTTIRKYFYLGESSEWDSNHTKTIDVTMKRNEDGTAVTDGIVATMDVDASAVYDAGNDAAAASLELTDGRNDLTDAEITVEYTRSMNVIARIRNSDDTYTEKKAVFYGPTRWINLTSGQISGYGFGPNNGIRVSNSAHDGGSGGVTPGTNYVWLQGTDGGWAVARSFNASDSTPSIGTPFINNPSAGYIRAAVTVNGTTYYGDSSKLTNDTIRGWGGPV